MKLRHIITIIAILATVALVVEAGAPAAFTAITNTSAQGPILTIGAHTRAFKATTPFVNGTAVFTYNRTSTSAFIDTLYIPARDSLSYGCDSTCYVNIARESGQWWTAVVGAKYPTITWLANPTLKGAKINYLSISFPAGDTLTGKLIVIKPNR